MLPLVWFTVETSIVVDSATICVVNGLVVVISSLVDDICDSEDGSKWVKIQRAKI